MAYNNNHSFPAGPSNSTFKSHAKSGPIRLNGVQNASSAPPVYRPGHKNLAQPRPAPISSKGLLKAPPVYRPNSAVSGQLRPLQTPGVGKAPPVYRPESAAQAQAPRTYLQSKMNSPAASPYGLQAGSPKPSERSGFTPYSKVTPQLQQRNPGVSNRISRPPQPFPKVVPRMRSTRTSSLGRAILPKVVQRHKVLAENQIPVQTAGNCGLFAIIAAMRAFGFQPAHLSQLEKAMDKWVAESDETFQGEIFSVDLMLRLVNGILFNGKPVLHAIAVTFQSPLQLGLLLEQYSKIDDVTLLIGYSKPDEYDTYYSLRGQYLSGLGTGPVSKENVTKALDDSIGVTFKSKDAHWGMINQLRDGGLINIADTITEFMPGSGHGYNTLIGLHSLYESSMALNQFDWSNYIKNDRIAYNTMDKTPKSKDLNTVRYQTVKSNSLTETMDLSGRLVVINVTEYGKTFLQS